MAMDLAAVRTATEHITGAWRAQSLYTAVKLGIPDHIAAGMVTDRDITEAAGAGEATTPGLHGLHHHRPLTRTVSLPGGTSTDLVHSGRSTRRSPWPRRKSDSPADSTGSGGSARGRRPCFRRPVVDGVGERRQGPPFSEPHREFPTRMSSAFRAAPPPVTAGSRPGRVLRCR